MIPTVSLASRPRPSVKGLSTARLVLLFLLACLAVEPVYAQQDEIASEWGLYLTRTFGTRDYRAHAQNWAVVQDASGLIYVGNGTGLLEYDGVSWRSLDMPGNSAVRSLALAEDGTVFAGGHGTFGYLAPDSSGLAQYVSLSDGVVSEVGDVTEVWKIVPTPEGVFFSTRERLFRYREGEPIRHWKPDIGFLLGFGFEGHFHTVDQGRGLVRFEGDEQILVPGGERFARGAPVYFTLPRADGSILLGVPGQGLIRFDGCTFEPFETEADERLRRDVLYQAAPLADGGMALLTRHGGVYLLSAEGRLLRVIDEENGLPDRNAWAGFQDREGGLWVALNRGIARIDLSSPLTQFDADSGLLGMVIQLHRHEGVLHVATSMGVFRLVSAEGQVARFEPVVSNEFGQCLGMASTSAGLLVSCEMRTVQVTSAGVREIEAPGARMVFVHESAPDMAFLSAREGTFKLVLRGREWVSVGRVEGMPAWFLSAAVDSDDVLWMTTTSGTISSITDWQTAVPTVEAFGEADGVPRGYAYVTSVRDGLRFHTQRGVMRFANGRFEPDEAISAVLPDPEGAVYLLREGPDGRLWFNNEYSGVAQLQADGSYRLASSSLFRLPELSLTTLHVEESGVVWVGTEGGVMRYVPSEDRMGEPLKPLIRHVQNLQNDAMVAAGPALAGGELTLRPSENALRFVFALPSFGSPDHHRYRVRLDGFDRDWSSWSMASSKDYTNLPPGRYTFRVQARDAYGRETGETTMTIRIRAPWTATWWARTLQGLLAAGFLVGLTALVMRYRTRRLRAVNERLEREVWLRTETLAEANAHLREAIAKNGEFLSIAAHDLKNPLTSILGFADILLEEHASNPEAAEMLTLVRDSAMEMRHAVRQLQDTEAIESDRIRLRRDRLDLSTMAETVVRRNRAQAAAKNIEIHLDAPRPVLANVDPQYFPRVLDNLLSNAIKFSPHGKRAWVHVAQKGSEAVVAIEDEGPGLTAEDQARAFEALQRLSARPTGGEGSTGLGLYIVDKLVRLHGGTVHIESEPGDGATFVVTLPLVEVASWSDSNRSTMLSMSR